MQAAQVAVPEGGVAKGPRLDGRRVLIVDDDPDFLSLVASALKEAGCRVETSRDVWIASEVATFRPDCIVLDVEQAGGCSGPALVRALRKRRMGQDILFVFYSRIAEQELEQAAAQCCALYLGKDAPPEELVRMLAELGAEYPLSAGDGGGPTLGQVS